MDNEIIIRDVTVSDAPELLDIYAPYVLNTAVTFEYDVPTADEFINRIEKIRRKYPYIAAQQNGVILGYAYAGAFKERAAYNKSAETTIYVKEDSRRCHIGSRLYSALEEKLRTQGILNMNACIAYPETEDEYLTFDSFRFHEKMDFDLVGEFHKCGYKFGRWYNMIWMEKLIGEHL
ncbi:MAG: GNAT family N-acetyltransferase [Oscillospiraceae bacterium]|nr:GNAT family N-acetyltransferase [Oscillospiraceae bacterium]